MNGLDCVVLDTEGNICMWPARIYADL